MRKLFFAIGIFTACTLNAQNYLITFSGNGASSLVTTVKVENLTAGTTLSLNGSDILRLTGNVGIPQLSNNSQSMKIYPNPMTENSTIEICAPAAGDAIITVYEMTGKPLTQIYSYLDNTNQAFKLSGLRNGLYLINVTGGTYQFSGKLLCNGLEDGVLKIEKGENIKATINEISNKKNSFGNQATVDMPYTTGDRLKFTATTGNYSTVQTDIPTQDKTLSFNFIECKDGDNNHYSIVEINDQIWMGLNLKATKYNDGNTIPIVTDGATWAALNSPGYCWYNNDPALKPTYGALYNWYTLNTGKLCPEGWHVPGDAEWTQLTNYLAGESVAGGKLKETGTIHWTSPNAGATNENGFTSLPGGYRESSGTFTNLGAYGGWWSSSESIDSKAWNRFLYSDNTTFVNVDNTKSSGFSVRCLLGSTPSVSTSDATSIASTSATVGGDVSFDGNSTVTERGVYWGTSTNPKTSGTKLQIGSGKGSFTSLLTGLTPGATYYAISFATNNLGTSYGNEISFTTLAVIPNINTSEVSEITQTNAASGGNIISDGGGNITAFGVCWNTSINPTISNSKTEDGSGTEIFTSSLNGLEVGTTYYLRAYATNSAGTAYGNEITFTTDPAILPSVSTTEASAITQTTADVSINISSDGGATVTVAGFCWSTSINPTIANSKTVDIAGTGGFVRSLTGLAAGTVYYVRAYATNSVGTVYGNEISFTTNPATIPILTTLPVTSVTQTTASSGGNVTSDGASVIFARGICWDTSVNPTTANSKTSNETGIGEFISSVSGLFEGTTYYLRAYATNSVGTAYGNESSFTTLTLPSITTTSISSITGNTAISGGHVSTDGGANVTEYGVCWSTSVFPTITNNKTSDGTGIGEFSSSLTGLIEGTSYYVRAFATNSIGTAYGSQESFTTLSAPILTTTAVSGIKENSASAGGEITSDGGAIISARGVCWSTNPNPTITSSITVDGAGKGIFASNISGLTTGTTYYVRGYATNSVGTAYGTEVSFTTLSLPSLTTNEISSITGATATSGGNIINNGGSDVIASGICWNTITNPTITNSKTEDGIVIGSFTSTLSNLALGTTYFVRAYATNSIGTAYGNLLSFTTLTLPSISTVELSSITGLSVISGGIVTNDGGAQVNFRGVCWSTSLNPSIFDNFTTDGNGTGTYSSSIIGLTSNITYYIRAYATNNVGTTYGNEISFKTPLLPNLTSASATAITGTSAKSGGEVIDNGGNAVLTFGVCWHTNTNPTIANSFTKDTLDGNTTGKFKSLITGLEHGTTYFLRSYATTIAGTAYGNEINFTTIEAISVGDNFEGGVVAYFLQFGDPGYDTNIQHGLIVAPSDQSIYGIQWYNGTNIMTGASGTAIGTGNANTNAIINAQGMGSYAARLCYDLVLNGYSDWYLPSKDELNMIFLNKVGGLGGIYWNSTENYDGRAWIQDLSFAYTSQGAYNKSMKSKVRAVRSFTTPCTLPAIATSEPTSITRTSVISGGKVTGLGGTSVVRGICWGESPNPTITNSLTNNGTGIGTFTSSISGLTNNTTYYLRAFATNALGTAYGNEISFKTEPNSTPSVSTVGAINITSTSSTISGNIIESGGTSITENGFFWGTSQNVELSGKQLQIGSGLASITYNLSGLTASTLYFVKAYATNYLGTSYGNEVSFTTLPPSTPTVSTTPITTINYSMASIGGNVEGDGGNGPVMENGLYWGTSLNPETTGTKLQVGSGTGVFSAYLSGLSAGTTYYVKAYAVNSLGTAYGAQQSFQTFGTTVTDIDGNVYNVVTIGSQDWLKQNLKTTRYNDGGSISNPTTNAAWSTTVSGAYSSYTNFGGKLYNWYAASDPRICPTGWHVPNDNEWSTLISYSGGDAGAAYKLKEAGTTSWISPNTADNSTGFTALGAGYRSLIGSSGSFTNGKWWSTDEQIQLGTPVGLARGMSYNTISVTNGGFDKKYGLSIRCLRDSPPPVAFPTISTTEASQITLTTASCGGYITNDGGAAITARGLCWSTSPNPTLSDSVTTEGTSIGSFVSELNGLISGTTYYVRAYCSNTMFTAYGNEISFQAIALTTPILTTVAASSVSDTSAISGGIITNEGASSVTARGVCWSTSVNPKITDQKTIDGAGTGTFTSSITGLTAGVTFYARAYATNSAGTAYGNEINFVPFLNSIPVLTSTEASFISESTASSGGNISWDGGAAVTLRGVCWSTTINPTISDNKTEDGSGTGVFTSSLSGLMPSTSYYLRAYAINIAGTAYGNELSFTTAAAGTVTDIDGNLYTSVVIGTQVWMVENLKVTKLNDGSPISLITDVSEWLYSTSPGYAWYNNDELSYKNVYGALYNLQAAVNSKLCPTGWHVPSDAEWTILTDYLGGISVAGGKLTESGLLHWKTTHVNATNESGFTGLPGGVCTNNGMFLSLGDTGNWWTTTTVSSTASWYRYLGPPPFLTSSSNYVGGGRSVRCVK
jgi:uncharacterized protein (TIGR02145 family)